MNECVGGLTSRSPLRIEQPRREVMVEPEAVTTLLRLRALGWGSKRIARELGLSRGTVKRYIEAGGWQPFSRPKRRKLLDDLDDWLRERFRRHRGNADVVRQELAAEKGIVASLRTVQRGVEPYRQELLAEARATVRFGTAPGRQLQIDFGRHPERQAARGPRGRGWSRSPGAK
jgi:transposase